MEKQAGSNKTAARTRGRASRKTQIVAATERLLRERGLAGVTTRAIAEAVPCSEGAIYVHFRDRLELLLAVLEEALPAMREPLRVLDRQAGQATPAKNLRGAVAGLLRFHKRVTPMLCALLMDQELRQRFADSLLREGKGPRRGIATLARYIERERNLGRVDPRVDARTAAAVLMAGSFFAAFTAQLFGTPRTIDAKRLVALTLRANMN